jgi:chemotaxis response regulator CheB
LLLSAVHVFDSGSYPPRHRDGMAYKSLVVDDSPVIRSLIRFCIEQRTNWQVCGEAENGEVVVGKVAELNPDVVILDLQMPVMNGLDAGREIGRKAPNIPI